MKANPNQTEAWGRAHRMAFWDQGKLDYAGWRKAFKSGKVNVIRQSINYMQAADLIALIGGRPHFIKVWPLLRSTDELNQNKKAILDGAWGMYVVGDASFPVYASLTRFHPKKLGTLRALAKGSGLESIYQIAKMTGRNYRRVYDDIMDFVDEGIAIVDTKIKNGRMTKVPRLPGIHPCP